MIAAKAQSALEYLMVIALAMGIIVPITYMFFQYSSESNVQIIDVQVTQIGRNIIDTAESVYYSGEGSKIVLEINMPENVEDVSIMYNRELVFNIITELGETEIVFFSDIDILITSDDGESECVNDGNCDLSSLAGSGLKKVEIKSEIDEADARNKVFIRKFVEPAS